MEKNREANRNRTKVTGLRNVEGTGAVGGRSLVVRTLAAQASDLGSIPGGFPAHSPFSARVSINIFNTNQ